MKTEEEPASEMSCFLNESFMQREKFQKSYFINKCAFMYLV